MIEHIALWRAFEEALKSGEKDLFLLESSSRYALPAVLFAGGHELVNVDRDADPFRGPRAANIAEGFGRKTQVALVGSHCRPRFNGLDRLLMGWRNAGDMVTHVASAAPVGRSFQQAFMPDVNDDAWRFCDTRATSVTELVPDGWLTDLVRPVILVEPTLDATFAVARALGHGYRGMERDVAAINGCWIEWGQLSSFARECVSLTMGRSGPRHLSLVLEHLLTKQVNPDASIDRRTALGRLVKAMEFEVFDASAALDLGGMQLSKDRSAAAIVVPQGTDVDLREVAARVMRDIDSDDYRSSVNHVLLQWRGGTKNRVFTTVVSHFRCDRDLRGEVGRLTSTDLSGDDPKHFTVPAQASHLLALFSGGGTHGGGTRRSGSRSGGGHRGNSGHGGGGFGRSGYSSRSGRFDPSQHRWS
ncbi:MAG: hypothetical protein KC925_01455 [Candidatus Doudnabacteria bacterium]|nr:hypothetical protein [Candidatus Doudnabacteria bacterium]